MNSVIYTIILSEVFIRYIISSNRSVVRLQILLMSAMIQSLMIFPMLFSPLVVVNKRNMTELTTPYGKEIGIMFPTIISLIIVIISKVRYRWKFSDIQFPFYVILLAIAFSYLTPYNYSFNATNFVLVLFVQIWIVVVIAKTYLTPKQIMLSIYDGFRIIVIIEFVISFTYVLGINTLQSLFISNIDEVEWIREGTFIRRAYGTTYHPNRLGGLCAFTCIQFISSFLSKYKAKQSLFWAAISLGVVILSQSRSALMATLFSITALFYIYQYKRRKLSFGKILTVGVGAFLLLLGLLSFSIVGDMLFASDVEDQSSNRLVHYLVGWLILNDTSFVGVGLNAHVHYMYYQMNYWGGAGEWFKIHAIHSIHMIIFVELGIIGFITWLYFLFSRVINYIRTSFHQMNNPLLWTTYIGMLFIVFVQGFTDPVYFQYQYLILLFLLGAFSFKDSIK